MCARMRRETDVQVMSPAMPLHLVLHKLRQLKLGIFHLRGRLLGQVIVTVEINADKAAVISRVVCPQSFIPRATAATAAAG